MPVFHKRGTLPSGRQHCRSGCRIALRSESDRMLRCRERRYVPKPPLVENRPVYAGQFIIEAPEPRAVSTVESGTNWTSHPAFINNHLRRFIATTVRPPTKSAMSETTFAKTS